MFQFPTDPWSFWSWNRANKMLLFLNIELTSFSSLHLGNSIVGVGWDWGGGRACHLWMELYEFQRQNGKFIIVFSSPRVPSTCSSGCFSSPHLWWWLESRTKHESYKSCFNLLIRELNLHVVSHREVKEKRSKRVSDSKILSWGNNGWPFFFVFWDHFSVESHWFHRENTPV